MRGHGVKTTTYVVIPKCLPPFHIPDMDYQIERGYSKIKCTCGWNYLVNHSRWGIEEISECLADQYEGHIEDARREL